MKEWKISLRHDIDSETINVYHIVLQRYEISLQLNWIAQINNYFLHTKSSPLITGLFGSRKNKSWKCVKEKLERLYRISLITVDNWLINIIVVIFLFSCWKIIKAAIYKRWEIISPNSSRLCLLADHITLLNPWARKPFHRTVYHDIIKFPGHPKD